MSGLKIENGESRGHLQMSIGAGKAWVARSRPFATAAQKRSEYLELSKIDDSDLLVKLDWQYGLRHPLLTRLPSLRHGPILFSQSNWIYGADLCEVLLGTGSRACCFLHP